MSMVHIKHLKKGETLLAEGDTSASMYWVQSGSLRLFKKKGSGFIELGVVHSGEVVGELSFLDNQPRSASVEALQPCDVIEIPRGKFDEFIDNQPSWMKSLIHTLVKRLRSTNNRIRELESSSTVYAQDEDGKSFKQHEFLSTNEVLKLCTALLLIGTRNAEKQGDGTFKVKAAWLQLYAGHVMNIHLSKITIFLDTMQEAHVIRIDKQKDHVDIYIKNVNILERFIYWLNEEHSKVEDKQIQLSAKAMLIMDAIAEHGGLFALPPGTESHAVNMEEVFQKVAAQKNEKFPFDWSAFDELVKMDFSKELRLASPTEKIAAINVQRFTKLYSFLAIRHRFRELNSKKRGA